MKAYDVYSAIKTRLESDTGSGGLFNTTTALIQGGIYNHYASNAEIRPLIVIDVEAENSDAFGANIMSYTITVHAFSNASDIAGADDYSKIMDRIWGDGSRSPAYGLHRWTLSLSNGWTGGGMIQVSQRVVLTDDNNVFHSIQTFRTMVSKAST